MNLPLLTANIIIVLAFFIHVWMGDKEFIHIVPHLHANNYEKKREVWTMARGAFHIISIDIFCLNILLPVINFTAIIPNENVILKLVSIYFLLWAVVFLFIILLSEEFKNRFIKLGQWILFSVLSGLLYWAAL
jgi:hypothetical protein